MKHQVHLVLGALLLFALTSSHLGAAFNADAPLFTRLAGPVSVPAEFSDRAFFVNVSINDRGPFHMLVDTGSSVSLLMPAVATAVEARAEDPDGTLHASRNGFGDEEEIPCVLLRSLEIGGARFEGVLAGVSSGLTAVARAAGQRVDGVLGFSLFSDVFLTLDFPRQRLVLDSVWPSNLPPVRAELALRIAGEVPLVTALLQGRDVELLIDTGSNRGLQVSREFANRAGWKAEPRSGPLVNVVGETGRELIGRLAGEFHFDRVTQIEPVAGITDGAPSVGVGFLQHFCVVFDQTHDKLWLCAASGDPVPAPPERSLGLSLLADAAGWRVAGTIPGSPAEGAGIAAGDIVTRIEGQSAANWSRDQINRWTDQHSRVALSVLHNLTHRDLILPVWPLVP